MNLSKLCLRSFLLLVLMGAASVGWASVGWASEKPNVLFLFADDQRPDTIGALGNEVIKTPNLDALAKRGLAFDNAYCMGSTMGAVCNPSRHQTLSGMSLYRYKPKQKENTWGDVFRDAGYVTFHLSKRGNTAREYHTAFEYSSYLQDNKERTSGHHGRTAADTAIKFLKEEWDQDKPLFMYIGFAGPHDPRVAAPEWLELYDAEDIPLPENFKPFHPIDNGWMTGRDERLAPWPRTESDTRRQLHAYYACISSIDHHVGRILDTFKELGELENTYVIYSADHGLAMGSHGLFGKQNLYEHSMQSPMIFAGPGIKPGRTDAMMYLFDIFPTATELAGLKVPVGLDGKSVAPVIRGERTTHRDTIFLAYEKGQRAVRKGDWKLYRFPLVNYTMLFNLAEDPLEQHNLAEDPAQAKRVEDMMTLLAEEQETWDDPNPHTSESPGEAKIKDASWFPTRKRDTQK